MKARFLRSIDPATEELVGEFAITEPAAIGAVVARARGAQADWQALGVEARSDIVGRAGDLLEERAEAIAADVTREMGKIAAEATAEVLDAANRLRYFASQAPTVLAPRTVVAHGVSGLIEQAPHGVVAAIKPWNFPISIPLWSIAPALLAGNSVIFKPSELVPRLGAHLAELFWSAGVPDGVLQLTQGAEETGRALVAAAIDMVGFVGSRAAGVAIMRDAAEGMKRLALELGGKDPMIVLADADLERAALGATRGAFKNCGQVCCSVERVYVESPLYDRFVQRVRALTEALAVGPGDDPASEIGPMVTAADRQRVLDLVAETEAAGATRVCGGEALDGPGFFIRPALLVDVPRSARINRDETFGPVLVIHRVASAEEALHEANALPFGLTATVWSRDIERATAIARRLEAGTRAVNMTVGSMVEFPWGGRKGSGIGRMLADEGLLHFAEPVTTRIGL
ncbi:MAG: aldehyde dehydrogenase [Myxococcales bacterium]|nr:aldehyde dehydrogenase [Myxococcales bacterium]